MQNILDGYAAAATPSFVAAYDALSSDVIYRPVIDLFPKKPSKVLDVGAGTGRDAAWFADQEHQVLAVEPVAELREAGQVLHRSNRITWLDDRLPHLTGIQSSRHFDLVTLCAVWQHLPDEDRALAIPRLATLLGPRGQLVMSLRHGPGVKGRPVFPVSVDATIDAATGCGLSLVRRREAESVQKGNRANGVVWTWLVLQNVRR
jgi:SAM-dependent methyltransferase